MRIERCKQVGLVLIGLMAIQLRCAKPSELAAGDITGTVIDSITGETLPGVTVSTEPITVSVHTNTEGQFTIAGVSVGEYYVKYHKDGYQDAVSEQRVYVRKSESARADFQLRPLKGVIFGRVTDVNTGQPIAGASITTTPPTESKTSDSDGNYTLGPIGLGAYTMIVTAAEYKDASRSVHLEAGDRKQMDFQLLPFPSPKVTITQGPGEGVLLTFPTPEVQVTFGWEGNTPAYRYRVLNSSYYKDFRETDASSVVLDDLDESPEGVYYTFEIVGVGEDGRESQPEERLFRIDAIRGPAVWLRSRRVQIPDPSVNPEFTVDVMAEEVVDLLMAHLVVRFDPERMKIRTVDREDFLSSQSDPDHLLFLPSDVLDANGTGVFIVDMGVLGSNGTPAVSGSGALARIRFSVLGRSQDTTIDFGPDTKLVNASNEDMALQARIGSTIEIR